MVKKKALVVMLFVLFILVPYQSIGAETEPTADDEQENEEEQEEEEGNGSDEEEVREESDNDQEAEEEELDSDEPNDESSEREEGTDENENTEEELNEDDENSSSLQYGDSGEEVVTLKKNLRALEIGNYSEDPSDDFDDATEENVREFQAYYGLEASGVADEETLSEIDEVLDSPYQEGESGDHVVELKQDLNAVSIGSYSAEPSDYYGDDTERNVKELQATYGLLENGIADEVTLAQLDEMAVTTTAEEDLSLPYQDGDSGEEIVELKQKLTAVGIGNYPDEPSDYFGDSTENNVSEFQAYYGLEVSGEADEATLSTLDDILDSAYQDGESGARIVELKQNLTAVGIGNYPDEPSNYFGDDTERNVETFQEMYGLLVNGIADEVTLAELDEATAAEDLSMPYQDGDSGEEIVELKQKLTAVGIGNYPDEPSDYFGDSTENNVSEFQAYYGLEVSGEADEATLSTIDDILDSAYQDGESGDHIVELKQNLTAVGIGNYPDNPSDYFGDDTERNVATFQEMYGLLVNGIADEVTLAELEEATTEEELSLPYQDGDSGEEIVELKQNLTAVGIGNYPAEPSDYFGDSTENNVSEFQAYYGLEVSGEAGEATLSTIDDILASPYQDGESGAHIVELKQNLTAVGIGNYPDNPSDYFGDDTERNVKEFQAMHGLLENGIADDVTLAALDEIAPPYQDGDRHHGISEFKKDLTAVGIGNYPAEPSDYFGDDTERNVQEFQAYYGLTEDGVANEETLAKMNEILNSSYQNGESGDHIVELKQGLTILGIGNYPESPSIYFGGDTERNVKEFQASHGLLENGIADDMTLAALDEYTPPFQDGDSHQYIVELKQNLTAVGIGNYPENPSDYFGDATEANVMEFQEIYGLPVDGVVDEETLSTLHEAREPAIGYVDANISLNVREGPSTSYDQVSSIPRGEQIVIIGEIDGWYKIRLDDVSGPTYVSGSLVELFETSDNEHIIYTTYDVTFDEALSIQMNGFPQVSAVNGGFQDANESAVAEYLDPNNNDRFQHLLLTESVGVSANQLNNVLSGSGILEGTGQSFIDAGNEHSVNEIYLIAHALLETGHGTSNLATGIEVGENSSGNAQVVTSGNRNNLINIQTTYNMFGIGAADSNPDTLGAIHAYNEGWFSPEEAIVGGAEFISQRYIHNEYNQNTLYKMRWNPANPGYPQYATDIGWAVKQVPHIKNMYEQLNGPDLYFDMPQYQ